RPSKFIKPAARHPISQDKSPTDLDNIAKLFLRYNHKMYIEGYLTRMIDITPEGQRLENTHWKDVFAELSGSTLAIWDAEKSNRQEGILPSYVNIMDASMEILNQDNIGKPNCFAIQNTAGANRFVFQARTRQDMEKWEICFWLASFEGTKLHEIYTRKILVRSMYQQFFTKQPSSGLEGYLQVRFAGKSAWQRLWTVMDKKDNKKRWGRKTMSPFPGHILLYEDKKSKIPLVAITNVARAYAIYPENLRLSDHATLFKIEGSVSTVSNENLDIPDRISHVLFMANSSKEMAQWLMSTFDIFKLYGRPYQMSFNPVQPDGIHYSTESLLMEPGKLFLDVREVQDKRLCHKKRWDQKGVFADELQRKLDFSEDEPKQELSPKSRHSKLKSIQSSHISLVESKTSSMASFTGEPSTHKEVSQKSPTTTKHESVSIGTKQIGDSSDDDTEDDIVDDTDEESDDSSTFKFHQTETVSAQSLSSPTQQRSEQWLLTRQSSASSSFLLDFGNLSASRNTISSRSSTAASTSPIFGDFARSSDFSKYIDQTSLVDEEAKVSNIPGSSLDSNSALDEFKEAPSSLPKPKKRGFFPQIHKSMSSITDDDDDNHALEKYSKDWQAIEEMGGRMGPPIPSLGDHFASQNSLLDQKPSDLPMTAQEQTEYARAMRQPFLHVPVRPKNPRSGLIGKITQLESERRDSEKRVADKVEKANAFSAEIEKECYTERERDRQLMEHRQQQMLQQMLIMNGGFAMMPVIQTPHGIMPVLMPYPMTPQTSMSTPVRPMMRSPDPRMPPIDPRVPGMQFQTGASSSSLRGSTRSPFPSSSASSPYTAASIHSQFNSHKHGHMFGPQAASSTAAAQADSSEDEDDYIPIAKTTPKAKRRSEWLHPRGEKL
ncbi:hypothetical protein BGW37DRAFT_540162, partial [Umbelopsis sp. PMI_123]